MKMLRLPAVMERTGISRASIWAKAKIGEFPAPIKLGPRTTAWNSDEVDEWIANKIAESTEKRDSGNRRQ